MRPTELHTVRTSPGCISYSLVAAGRIVWSNRVHDRPEGQAGTRPRLAAWAAQHGYREIVQEEETLARKLA